MKRALPLQAKTAAVFARRAHRPHVPSAQEITEFLRDEIGSAEEIEKLTTVEVERVHLIAQGFMVATEEEALRLEMLYRCVMRAPHSADALNDWLVAPRTDGPAPWFLIRGGRLKDLEALLG